MLLVEYNSNWSDEMNIDGFKVMSEAEYEVFQQEIRKYFKTNSDFIYYIGTNEEIPYESAKDMLRDFTVREINDTEADVLNKLFPHGYGFFPDLN